MQNPIVAAVLFAARRHVPVLAAALAVCLGCIALAAMRLDVTTDVGELFSASLPWKRRELDLRAKFPQFTDLLVAVVQADNPEEADATAAGLMRGLEGNPHVRTVRRPDASPFFDKNGLLFLDQPVLETLLNQTIDAQPFLGQLAADPSARGLFSALSLVGLGVERGQADLGPFAPALGAFDAALRSALDGKPVPLSWQRLLSGPVAELGGPYRFVLVQPKLDYGAVTPGGAASQAIRDAAAGLDFVRGGQAKVRITGSVALADEEFASAAQGAVVGLAASTVIVVLWLFLAVRSWRLVLPILCTLFSGLLLTTAFATLTVNPLNLISVAFAILFVGIAVDFAIQFSVRFREQAQHVEAEAALEVTARRSGKQILVAAAATSAGFLAFVPTDFEGVAELGLIAGVGMLIAFACTLTVLPAAIVAFRPRRGGMAGEAGFGWAAPLDRGVVRGRWALLAMFGVVAAAGLGSTALLRFDSDPLHTKDPDTEAMRTLADLAANPLTDPYTIDVLARDQAAAQAVVARAQGLPLVAQVISLDSFVPRDQQAKLALISDAASLLAATLAPQTPAAPVTAADIRLAAQAAGAQLAKAVPKLPGDHPLAAVAADLKRLATADDTQSMAANQVLTRFLPAALDRLRLALQAGPVTEAAIPPEIARDWKLADGTRRVEIAAKPEAAGAAGLRRFVDEVGAAVPDTGGSAVTIVETANTIIRAFTRAAAGAMAAIVIILALVLRRVLDVALVLSALVLSGLMTILATVLVGMPLNFANVIALPLLLGVGVSFNIYFVMNWRGGQRLPLSSPTARAVVFSALTTGTAFGSLALSAHPGTASMGRLLLLSLMCSLLASLVFVPALLATISTQDGAYGAPVKGV